MAQTIAQSLEILNETMTNSKTALQDKGVSVEDTYKLSDVDEKIAEIQVGGGDELPPLKLLEYIKLGGGILEINNSNQNLITREEKMEVKAVEEVWIHYKCNTISCDKTYLEPGETATITLNHTSQDGVYPICFCSHNEFGANLCEDVFFFCCYDTY